MQKAANGAILRCALGTLFAILCASTAPAQQAPAAPSNPKAEDTFQQGVTYANRHMDSQALSAFRKADKQDGGQCAACQVAIMKYGLELRDWNSAKQAAQEEVANAHGDRDAALAHYDLGRVLFEEGQDKHKQEIFVQSHEEFAKAIGAVANFPDAWFLDGRALAELNADDPAKAEFAQFLKIAPVNDIDRERAQRYLSNIGLARERMAPAFEVTAMNGQRVSLDDFSGKVVLLDFWATWCEPCREALPNIERIAQEFKGRPLVILSVSLDPDPQKWKDFVAKNHMTWLQYRDGYFNGPISRLFGVDAIPHTFTVDADGVLRDERIGEVSIEGRLKKLVAQAETEKPEQRQAQ